MLLIFVTSGLSDFVTSGFNDFVTFGFNDFVTSGLKDFVTSGFSDFVNACVIFDHVQRILITAFVGVYTLSMLLRI